VQRGQAGVGVCAIRPQSWSTMIRGRGGYLQWQDEKSSEMDGNGAAWPRPRSPRKEPINLARTKAIFTFRAREKTRRSPKPGSKTGIIRLGRQCVAPSEIVRGRGRTCTQPPRADGVAAWRSDKIGDGSRRDRARSGNARTTCVSHHEMSWRGGAARTAIDGYYPVPTWRCRAENDPCRWL
jgi:hypothetical protein